MRRRRNPEIVAGRVNADGSIAAGSGFSVQRTGVGVYVITFADGFRPLAVHSVVTISWYLTFTEAYTGNSVRVVVGNPGGTATLDQMFAFTAIGAAT